MIRRYRHWRRLRNTPVVKFGQDIRVEVNGVPYFMQLEAVEVRFGEGARATLRTLDRFVMLGGRA